MGAVVAKLSVLNNSDLVGFKFKIDITQVIRG